MGTFSGHTISLLHRAVINFADSVQPSPKNNNWKPRSALDYYIYTRALVLPYQGRFIVSPDYGMFTQAEHVQFAVPHHHSFLAFT